MNIETKLGLDAFILDKEAHIVINQEICKKCEAKYCLYVCPGRLYSINQEPGRWPWSSAAAWSAAPA